jgi:hypothetical protein
MTRETLSAFIFINPFQALRFGHIAWGFELSAGNYLWGSTDHLLKRPYWDVIALAKYAHVVPGQNVDYWSRIGSLEQMLDDMATGPHIRYHSFKELAVPASRATPAAASILSKTFESGGWSVLANNCVHQTHRILEAYGAAGCVPDPVRAPYPALIPVKYFAMADGVARELGKKSAAGSFS